MLKHLYWVITRKYCKKFHRKHHVFISFNYGAWVECDKCQNHVY